MKITGQQAADVAAQLTIAAALRNPDIRTAEPRLAALDDFKFFLGKLSEEPADVGYDLKKLLGHD